MNSKPTSVRALQKKTGASYYSAYRMYKENSSQEGEEPLDRRLDALFRENASCRRIVRILKKDNMVVSKSYVGRALKRFKVLNLVCCMSSANWLYLQARSGEFCEKESADAIELDSELLSSSIERKKSKSLLRQPREPLKNVVCQETAYSIHPSSQMTSGTKRVSFGVCYNLSWVI